jgi:16S rRNA (adenine1518-N6/adenine1519-N6)-dimethyltransferase
VNHHFKKSLGQNFITDTNLLNWMAAASGAGNSSTVLEIGTGGGTLTKALAQTVGRVVSFEIDKSLAPIIEEKLSGFSNVSVIYQDILKQDITELDNMLGRYYIVANLPYYITTPIIMHFLENSRNLISMTLMVQKEVAERLCAKAGSADYGSVTVAVDSFGGAKLLKNVSRELFYPRPNVDSAIIKIDINKNLFDINNREHFNKLYRAAFSMRRKTLANNIAAAFNISRESAAKAITECGFIEDIRGEKLSAADYAKLSNHLFSELK